MNVCVRENVDINHSLVRGLPTLALNAKKM